MRGRRGWIAHARLRGAFELVLRANGVEAGAAPLGQPAMFQAEYKQGRTLQEGDHFAVLIESSGPGGYFLELVRPVVLDVTLAVLAGFLLPFSWFAGLAARWVPSLQFEWRDYLTMWEYEERANNFWMWFAVVLILL